jgi:chitinase
MVRAQLPSNVLVGYHENWNTLKISQAHANYNVICLAFALPVNAPSVGYDLRYTLPAGYSTVAQMKTDIDLVHSQGKVVLLSIGGATGPIMLTSAAQQTTFENSINTIFATYGNKIDGIDMDLETSSMAFGAWTMSSPAAAQTRMVNAMKNVMATYQATNGKKMILTMAPEVIYLTGGFSTWQVANVNGGAFLPILDGLRAEFDLIHMQLYNAGGASGGVYAWNNVLYYDNGTMDFALAMNESIVKGFTCVSGKGVFAGIPASKIAFGFPATSSGSTAGTGYVTPANICAGVKYFKGITGKPAGVTYTMSSSYPSMRGLMDWSINEDYTSINGQWNFANGFTCSFTLPVTFSDFQLSKSEQGINVRWQTTFEQNANYFTIQKSNDGTNFLDLESIQAKGNSSAVVDYKYIDNSEVHGTVYYRIKEVDFNGEASYTDIKAIETTGLNVVVYPNPSVANFTIQLNQDANITIENITGTTISTVALDENYSAHFGDMLSPGIYLLSIQSAGKIERIRIVKK